MKWTVDAVVTGERAPAAGLGVPVEPGQPRPARPGLGRQPALLHHWVTDTQEVGRQDGKVDFMWVVAAMPEILEKETENRPLQYPITFSLMAGCVV